MSPGLLPFHFSSSTLYFSHQPFSFLPPTHYPTSLSGMACSLRVRVDREPDTLTFKAPRLGKETPASAGGRGMPKGLGRRDRAAERSSSQEGEAGPHREVGCSAAAFTPEQPERLLHFHPVSNSFCWRWLWVGWVEEGLARLGGRQRNGLLGKVDLRMDSQSLSQSPGEGSIRNPRQRHRDKEEHGRPDKARVLETLRPRQDARRGVGG